MKPTLLQRMDIWVRHLVPLGSSLFFLLLTIVPTRIPDVSTIMPLLPLMCVFYWSLYRPDLVSIHVVFGLGLLFDLLGMYPLGMHALVFLLTHGATLALRRFLLDASPMIMWGIFSLFAAAAYVLMWTATALLYGTPPVKTVFFNYIMTVSFYPLINWVLARLQVALLRDA